MTTKMEQLLRSTRRRMLRYIVGVRRKQDETWVEYIKRATHTSEDFATKCGVQSWIEIQRRKKWRIAGKAARCSEDRWCKRILNWQPWFRCNPKRDVGRPRTRWNDDIVSIAGESWTEAAADQAFWRTLEDGYLNKQWWCTSVWRARAWHMPAYALSPKTDTHRCFWTRNRILEPVRIFYKKYIMFDFSRHENCSHVWSCLFFSLLLFFLGGEHFDIYIFIYIYI